MNYRTTSSGSTASRCGVAVCAFVMLLGSLSCLASDIRVGVLKFGTVNWELDTLKHHRLDTARGIVVKVLPLASKNASAIALQGDAADVIVTDWLWVSRQRAAGRNYVFYPYSFAVGSLQASARSGIKSLADLKGKRLGVAGGPVDKSWLLLRAYGHKQLGVDLADVVEVSYVAPPLLNKLLMRDELDAGLNFWHYAARLRAGGARDVVTVSSILPALGVATNMPLLGWVFDAAWADSHPRAVSAFLKASFAAKQILDTQDAEWDRLKPRTKAANVETLAALRDAYRLGIPRRYDDKSIASAVSAYKLMAQLGGRKLTGGVKTPDPKVFWRGVTLPTWSH
jgi:NitT/TauT family transport system substrate-binding protein